MQKPIKFLSLCTVIFGAVFFIYSCEKNKNNNPELQGESITFFVDETLMPVMEDVKAVFESSRPDTVNLIAKSETEIVKLITEKKADRIVMARTLTPGEENAYRKEKIVPVVTQIGIDGIALVVNQKSQDSIVELDQIIDFLKGKPLPKFKGLVFDNPNSGTVAFFKEKAGIENLPSNVFSQKNNNEVLKFIAENDGYIGVVGVNWITQPMPEMQKFTNQLKVLAVKNVKISKDDNYYKPTQSNLGEGKYPLVRKIYMLNYEGTRGLGTAFVSFTAGSIGQKIFLRAGLAPARLELREVKVRPEIDQNQN
ncbi:phosphate ABC transporter substrate-binding protein [Flavobacterium sp. NST-5]|uniref:Phosphate ABC transporter substrate-binding protein n=1 Tax=Flavobacterium ichthyis TaxID=2698827 RepID=A0ABW9Z9V4_9FLAO|nr:substrate-binding domain-containing protein [Flavobacterium ichthyis]NBL65484.1 phosphate ABC transporter substrate-binding protein [Flavobacterium ichthyis]